MGLSTTPVVPDNAPPSSRGASHTIQRRGVHFGTPIVREGER
jgi:hypothetical protein